ncbi:MAG: flagellar basal body L-ring protein FlgH [Desulfonatronovibrionaceae bacterium]
MNIILRTVVICVAGVMLFACAPAKHKSTPEPAMTPEPPEISQAQMQEENPGSLFADTRSEYLFSDNRARNVGDIVRVSVVESLSAKNEASTDAERSSSVDLGVQNLFGQDSMRAVPLKSVFGVGRDIGPEGDIGSTPIVRAGSSSEFEGDGATERESDIATTVASRVVKDLGGGLLQIEGARQLRVNDETQIVVVRGLVRSEDIGPNNEISSDYLADAHIDIYGQGILTDKQKPGWLSRILDNIWPF